VFLCWGVVVLGCCGWSVFVGVLFLGCCSFVGELLVLLSIFWCYQRWGFVNTQVLSMLGGVLGLNLIFLKIKSFL